MYEKFKLNDLESTQKKISQSLIKYDLIIDAISFKNAIKKYLFGFQAEAIADECTRIAEMINCYFSEKNQSLYGDKLSKIINVIADKNGMALPDKINSEMKYMLVGLTSTTAIKSDSYILASSLLRSGFSIVQVYEQTGWFYNKLDKKWRYQISDADSKLHNYVEEQERKIEDGVAYIDSKLESVSLPMDFLKNLQGLTQEQIDSLPFLPQILQHDTLFNEYPSLAYIKCLYASYTSEKFNGYRSCYQLENHIVILGNANIENKKNVLLHEIQHAIQGIEKYSFGGNPNLATVGMESSQDLRDLFTFIKTIDNIVKKADLENQVSQYIRVIAKIETKDSYGFYLIQICANMPTAIDETIRLFPKQFSSEVYNAITKGGEIANRGSIYGDRLKGQGYSGEKVIRNGRYVWTGEIGQMIFKAYQNLLGELEARYTQATAYSSKEELSLFLPLSAETYDEKDIIVYCDDYDIKKTDKKSFYAAIEKYPDEDNKKSIPTYKYIMHLQAIKKGEPIVHELGHILYDDFTNYSNLLSAFMEEYTNSNSVLDSEEYFVECFLSYFKNKNEAFPIISLEVSGENTSNAVNKYADRVFNSTSMDIFDVDKSNHYLKFIKLLENAI
jgi:hypothetical protein